jgi:GAF domain-containing protein/HPt (histidine-containing phosphotransfer) domain-containing protein
VAVFSVEGVNSVNKLHDKAVKNGPSATIAGEILHAGRDTQVTRCQQADGRKVIVKQAGSTQANRRLVHEMAVLQHLAQVPGVSKVAAAGEPNSLVLVDDGSVALDRFVRTHALTVSQVIDFAHAAAGILAEVHRAGVIHRDLCTGNFLIHPQTLQPTLIDFSGARLDLERRSADDDAELACSWPYMSPEQTGRIGRTPDQRSDLYSLGITLYELLTHRRPFEAEDLLELVHDHLIRIPDAPSSVDPAIPPLLSNLVLRLLEKEPDRRYQSAEGLAQDLIRLQHGDTDFELGQFDFGARLNPPPHLIGRDAELATLRSIISCTTDGDTRCVLVAGAAGVGKSALLAQLRPLVTAQRAWLVCSKFEQYGKDSAAAALDIFQALGRQLLAEPEERLAQYRQRILQGLRSNLGVGPTLLPEFQLLLGKHPAVELTDAREVESRTTQAALDLLRSIATPERPLVLICDDVHWAPRLSQRLLDAIVAGPQPIPGLLMICAYRDHEVLNSHPLRLLIDRWKKLDLSPPQLTLDNLSPVAASEFVGAMLRIPASEADALAAVLGERTQHNVYNTIELLNALRQDGLLVPSNGHWNWDASAIRRDVGSTSVADLLNRRIGKLTAEACELLQITACLGGEVSTAVLTCVSGLDASEVQRRLVPSLDDGLLVSTPGEPPLLRFTNGRVQQAVFEGMQAEERTDLHLTVARRLVEHGSIAPDLEALAAEQYLAAVGKVSDGAERRRALTLFERAAQRLRLLNGVVAERYFAAAVSLLDAVQTPDDREQLYLLRAEHHRALFSLGRLDESDAVYAWLVANSSDPVVLSEPTRIQIYACNHRRRFPDALVLGLGLLRRLGMVKPDDVRPDLAAGFKRLTAWSRSDEKLHDIEQRPEPTDPQVVSWSMMLPESTMPSYFCDPPTWAWLNLEALKLWIEYGPLHKLMRTMTALPALLVGAPQDYRGSYEVGRHLLRVGEARGYEPGTSATRVMFALTSAHWVEPIESAAAEFLRSRADLINLGDESFFAVTFVVFDHMLDYAATLETASADLELGLATALRAGNADFLQRFQSRKQLLLALRGETNAPGSFETAGFDETAYQLAIDPVGPTAATYHMMRALTAAIFGDMATLATHIAKAIPLGPRTPGYYAWGIARVLQVLSLCEQACALPHAERAPLIDQIDSDCLPWLTARAADAPENFLHLLRWAQAERAWAGESTWAAGAAFDAAVQEATLHARPWHRAIISERAALFHLSHGMEHSARPLLLYACDTYEAWGASGKVKELRRAHACLRTSGKLRSADGSHSTSSIDNQMVDMTAILRASQALSSETSLVRLTDQVSKVLSTIAGATGVQLIVRAEEGSNSWVLANSLGSDSGSITVDAAGARGEFPLAAFRYAERTGELLVIDDATRDDRFSVDPYVQRFDQCSLLLSPVLKQGQLNAMLVLENKQRRAAFSADRLDAVAMIAGQLSVSLDNALLYASLEQRVTERTAQLRRKTSDINAMLQNMPQGVLTITAGGVIHPEYSAYLETILERRDVAHGQVMELLFSNTSLEADAVAQVSAAIGACIGEDQMSYEFNSHLLVSEFDKTLAEGRSKSLALSWSPICDEQGVVEKLMLCVRDVTELKRLENEASTRRRELQMIGEILAVAQEKFHTFVAGTRNFLEENRRLIEQTGEQREDTANHLLRNMHTIKGNARTFGLLSLTNVVHLAEQRYDAVRGNRDAWNRSHLLADLTTVRDMLETYVHVNDNVLGRKGPGRRGGVEKFLMVERGTVQQSLRALMSVDQSDAAAMRSALGQVAHMLNAIGTETLAAVLASTLEGLPSLAVELGKEPPAVTIEDHAIAIRTQASSLLRNVFTHLLRNSLDHGLEPATARLARGKPAAGRIQLRVSVDDGKLWIRLRDDGRGLALAKVRQRAIEQGLIGAEQALTADEVAQLIFRAGLSTAQQLTTVSGRGVGLDAVKGFIENEGGNIAIVLLDQDATAEFRAFETVLCLPDKYAASLSATLSFEALHAQIHAAEGIQSSSGSREVTP